MPVCEILLPVNNLFRTKCLLTRWDLTLTTCLWIVWVFFAIIQFSKYWFIWMGMGKKKKMCNQMTKYAQYNSIQELECKKRKKKAQSMCNLSFSVLKICPDHPGSTCHQFRLGCLSHCSFFGFTLLIIFFSFSLSFDGHFFLLCFIFALIFSLWKSVVLGTALTASGCLVLDFILKLPFIFLIFFPVNLEAKTDGTAENGTRWVGHPPAAEKRKGIKHLRFPLKRQNTF